MEVEGGGEGDATPAAATPATPAAPGSQPGAPESKRAPVKLSYEEYKNMATMFVHYLRKKEAENVRKSDVLNWYLEEMVTTGEPSQEELLEKKMIVEKVLDRLAYQDNILVPISKTGLKGKAAGDSMDDDMEPQ